MENEKIALMKERIQEQINNIDNKDFSLYFYVIDTKGVPSGSLNYIYDLALGLQNMGYKVGMLHNEEEFVGVEEWLGDTYASLEHMNIEKSKINVSPSDIIFIPEIFTNVMTATKKLPCQKVVILQSFDKLTELIPYGASLGDMGVFKAITTTEANRKRMQKYFPYMDIQVIRPKLAKEYNNINVIPNKEKQLIVNLVTRESNDINKIIKPFFWEYPMYQWVAFRELRGLSRDKFVKALNEAAITIWVDNTTDFGYTPLEAMKTQSIVIGKLPENTPEWMWDSDNNDNPELVNTGIWVDNYASIPRILASVIRTWTMDEIPQEMIDGGVALSDKYTEGKQLQDIKNVIVDNLIASRKDEYIKTLNSLDNNKNEKE